MDFEGRIDYAAETGRKFLIGLVFSAILHMLLLCNWPFYNRLFLERAKSGDIEVTYLKATEEPVAVKPEATIKSAAAVKKPEPKPEVPAPEKPVSREPSKVVAVKKSGTEVRKKEPAVLRSPNKPAAEETSRILIKQPVVPKIAAASVDASVDLKGLSLIPPSYYGLIRNRIEENLDVRRTAGGGDVWVRFVIASSGALKEVGIIDEKSTSDGIMRGAAFDAVKNSAPFPAFPEKIRLPEITFTCQISFSRR